MSAQNMNSWTENIFHDKQKRKINKHKLHSKICFHKSFFSFPRVYMKFNFAIQHSTWGDSELKRALGWAHLKPCWSRWWKEEFTHKHIQTFSNFLGLGALSTIVKPNLVAVLFWGRGSSPFMGLCKYENCKKGCSEKSSF